MRVKIREHVKKLGNVYNTDKVLEAETITKEIRDGKCYLLVDGERFEMEQKKADKMISEVFQYGVLDLSDYEITSIPW